MRNSIIIFSFLAAISPFNLFAQGAPVPHIFNTGDPIVASEINANYQELSNRNDTTQTDVDQNTSDITSVQSDISTIQSDITNLQTNSGNPLLQFVGNSTGTVNGGPGVRAMTELCQVDFADSRICTSEEYVKTISFPAAIPSTNVAWIQPAQLVGSGAIDSTKTHVTEVYSGLIINAQVISGMFNCKGWQSTSSNSGLAVNGVGTFVNRSCDSVLAVSCCK